MRNMNDAEIMVSGQIENAADSQYMEMIAMDQKHSASEKTEGKRMGINFY